ncbi:cell wall hydrolase [Maritimibacter sp. UBA3975]|uniref:cell wall hydrolase n=1 Tax=Maritimibacter sp. UBA3975 TaxID=1946833 RepID=UPI000C09EF5B|nr:cell wall hydrolase [Maritimibacter sp. UBA3975]MAM61657.1 cell wall hydrolase [Maritimibacter sp.]
MQGIRWTGTVALVVVVATVAGCAKRNDTQFSTKDHECMSRAMYFESNRSSRDGMVAVGSVVMNRVASDDFPNNVCGVVGQRGQFAPGVMSKKMTEEASVARVSEAAAAVLSGERHPHTGNARFFHALYYRANYDNMHYVASAGGNAFYEKRHPSAVTQPTPVANREGVTGGGETVFAMDAPRQRRGLLGRMFGR